MATRKFVFGNPPFKFLADHLAQDEDFLEDIKQIIDLDEDEYLRLATQLVKSDAFLSRSALAVIVGESLGEGFDRIANIIYRIGGIVHDAGMDATDAMDTLATTIEEKAKGLDVQDRRKLTTRLRKLVAEPIGIAKQYKARELVDVSANNLLRQLTEADANPSSKLICLVELTRFDPSKHEILLPLLWEYILAHRDSNNRDELVATGAAIRKYIAIMPMHRMGELAVLLESGHKSPLPIDLEIEVAKMIFRNFEAHPPLAVDTQPELAQRLWEMVQAYVNPRILFSDKHSAAASLAIEAIVAMRSSLAIEAWQSAVRCPFRWFAELVRDDIEDLREVWSAKSSEAAAWLDDLRSRVSADA